MAEQYCSAGVLPAPFNTLPFPEAATSVMLFTSFNMDRSCLQPSSINYFAHLSRLIASHNLLNHSYIACNCNCVFAENNAACYYANLRGPLFNECFLSKSSLWIRTRHSMRRLVSSEPMHVYALFTVFSWCSHASCKVLCVLLWHNGFTLWLLFNPAYCFGCSTPRPSTGTCGQVADPSGECGALIGDGDSCRLVLTWNNNCNSPQHPLLFWFSQGGHWWVAPPPHKCPIKAATFYADACEIPIWRDSSHS